MPSSPRTAAIGPCHNEELAIARVAREAGAIVRNEPTKGKGNVVRRAFADIDLDIYVLIDVTTPTKQPSCQ